MQIRQICNTHRGLCIVLYREIQGHRPRELALCYVLLTFLQFFQFMHVKHICMQLHLHDLSMSTAHIEVQAGVLMHNHLCQYNFGGVLQFVTAAKANYFMIIMIFTTNITLN